MLKQTQRFWKREVCIQIAGVNEFILRSRETRGGQRVAKITGQVVSRCSWLARRGGVNPLPASEASAARMHSKSPWGALAETQEENLTAAH